MNREGSHWRGKSVFVTGATGLLGPWLCGKLLDLGAVVTVLVRDRRPSSLFVTEGINARVNVVRGTLEDYPQLERTVNEYEVDTVFHLGAQAIVGTAQRHPVATFEANIRGTWNVLEACRRNPAVKAVVVASSDKAYGTNERLPYTEDMPLQGKYPYDVSKSCTDLIAQSYFASYRLPVCVTRCGNFFGGGDLNFNRIIPGTIRSVLENAPPVIRSDGTYIRDYLYVKDVVEAYLCLVEAMDSKDVHGEAFNFSTENRLTVLELTEKIIGLMGRPELRPVILDQAGNEIKSQFLSAEKARTELGWRPAYTFDQALGETIHWYRDYFRNEKPRV